MIELDGYICITVSCQRQAGLENNNSFTSPGTIVHVMHLLFMFFAGDENSKASLSVHALDVFIENATKMV